MLQDRVRNRFGQLRLEPYRRAAGQRVEAAGIAGGADYADLHKDALALSALLSDAPQHVVRLLLPTVAVSQLYAGIRTAIIFAANIARASGLRLEILYFTAPVSRVDLKSAYERIVEISELPHGDVHISSVWTHTASHPRDIYIVTFWITAMSAWVATQLKVVDAARVIYLIQDYEPEFYAASTESALCRITYQAGFTHVVNSKPLAHFLLQREQTVVRPELIFRPELDLESLAQAATARKRANAVRIAFYGRPGNPRNSFGLGVASLRAADRLFTLQRRNVEFVSMGERHADISLASRHVQTLGKLGWQEYFEQLARTDVMLSFQQTPHPSHPPLDAVASGTFAVVNELNSTRAGLSPRLLTASSNPVDIATRLSDAADQVGSGKQLSSLDEDFIATLGRPLAEVAPSLLADLV